MGKIVLSRTEKIEVANAAKRLLEAGASYPKIAAKYGVSVNSLKRWTGALKDSPAAPTVVRKLNPATNSGGRLLQVFENADCRCGHDGLFKQAESEINIRELKEGEYVAFFNTARTHLKLACANNVIAHRKSPHGRFFDLGAILAIVRAFHNTGEIQYEKAMKERLETLLARRGEKKEEE